MRATQLDETNKTILQKVKEGKTYKEIAPIVYLSTPSVKYRIRAMKDFYNCKTLLELVCKLT